MSASLYVSAWDQKTRAPITGLGTDAFAVREDGARREVLRVTPATSPMAVAILVDNSQAARDHIADIRKALDDIREGARAASARSRSSASPIARRSCATTPPTRSS